MKRFGLPAAALALVLGVAGCSDNNSSSNDPGDAAAPQKNLLFFLGDGMGITTMTAMRIYQVGEDGELTVDTLPESAFVRTYSEDAQVTDSAPSMAAYMTGVKMKNEVISMSTGTDAYAADGSQYISGADSACPDGNEPTRAAAGSGSRGAARPRLCRDPGDRGPPALSTIAGTR